MRHTDRPFEKDRPTIVCAALPLSITLFLVLSPVHAAVAQHILQPEDVANLEEVSDPRLSPDGAWLVFVQRIARRADEDRGDNYSVLWRMPAAGGEAEALTSTQARATRPRWSPDGRSIAYLDRRPQDDQDDQDDQDARAQMFVVPASGGEARQLSDSAENVRELVWAVDGSSLYFTHRELKSARRLEDEEKGRDWEVVDRDDRHLSLYRVGVGGGEAIQLTSGTTLREIAISPDGAHIAALGAHHSRVDDSYMFVELVTVELSSGTLTTIWDMPGKAAMPRFSPDGRWLACRAGIASYDPFAGSLFAVPAAGGAARNLTPDYDGSVDWFDFDSSGDIVLAATHGTATWLRRIDVDSGSIETLVESGPVYTAAHLSAGRLVTAASTPQHPVEILSREVVDGEWRRLTHSYPHLDGVRLGRQEVVEWRARDGLLIEGMLVYPLDYAEGRRYPLVVGIHGGPESALRNGWHTDVRYLSQLLAHRGAFSLLPNYRGSAGRGTAFLLANHGDPAGAEFQDILDGIQALDDRGLVDRRRVGIMGGSYGGYFSAWAATRYTDWFQAAVVNYGVSNLYSDWGDGDIPWEHRLVHWGWFPVDRPQMAMDRSPVSWVRGSRTATLIMHGKADPRVPPGQSRELYQGLRLNEGLALELVLFPRQEHGYKEAPHRLEATRRALQWFEEHLDLEPLASGTSGGRRLLGSANNAVCGTLSASEEGGLR